MMSVFDEIASTKGAWIRGPLLGFALTSERVDIGEVPADAAFVYCQDGHELASEHMLLALGEPPAGETCLQTISTARDRSGRVTLVEALASLVAVIGDTEECACPIVGVGAGAQLELLDIYSIAHLGRGIDLEGLAVLDPSHIEELFSGAPASLSELCDRYGVTVSGSHDSDAAARAAMRILFAQAARYPALVELSLRELLALLRAARSAGSTRLSPSVSLPEVAAKRSRGAEILDTATVHDIRSRAQVIAAAGRRVISHLAARYGAAPFSLAASYGRIARYRTTATHCEIWLQPPSKARALRLRLPDSRESDGLAWLAAELVESDDVFVLTAPESPRASGTRVDGTLVAICLTTRPSCRKQLQVVTCGPNWRAGAPDWPIEVTVPARRSGRRKGRRIGDT